MSEKEKNEPRRIDRGLVHPAIAMTAHMAHRLHAARIGAITAGEFRELFNSSAASEAWRDHGIALRTAALMVGAALQLQAVLGQAAALMFASSPSDPAMAEAAAHAQRTFELSVALGALADEFDGGRHA